MSASIEFPRGETQFSFEFCPPRTPIAARRIDRAIDRIAAFEHPSVSFVSVTYGAGGSPREDTVQLVQRISERTGVRVIPHVCGAGHTKREVAALVERYRAMGIGAVLALAGDPRESEAHEQTPPAFRFGQDVVRFLREEEIEALAPRPAPLCIGVAGYPEGHRNAPDRLREIDDLKRKVDAGANFICTQLFYSNELFFDFRERCELAGIEVPIVAGILPITSR